METWTHRLWMTERRQSPRFAVESLPQLKANLQNVVFQEEHLDNLSDGGCGFYAKELTSLEPYNWSPLGPLDLVYIAFQFEGITKEPVLRKGRICYSMPIFENEGLNYYGIRFIDDPKDSFTEMIMNLEHLYRNESLALDY